MFTTGFALLRSAGRSGQPLRLHGRPSRACLPFPPRLAIPQSSRWLPTIWSHETRRKQSTAAAASPDRENRDAPSRDEPRNRRQSPQARRRAPWWSHRLKYFDKRSPSKTLAHWMQNRADASSKELLKRDFAGARSFRLPVIMMQRMIRLEEEALQTDMSAYIDDPVEWRIKLNVLAFRGIELSDVDQWAWILSAEDDTTRLERFLATDSFKPMFVLLHILRKDAQFRRGDLFPALLEHIRQHHTGPDPLRDDPVLARNAVRRSLATRFNTTTSHFMILLSRLTHHCLHVWPAALPSVAQITCSYLDGIRNSRTQHQARSRSLVFNFAMRQFQKPSPQNPVLNTKYNWKAQRILLAYSTSLDRPLVIDQQSYRAMRRVMVGLDKSWPEKMVTARQARTWPPFRQNWDGLDERREAQDDFSRSVKAGVVARENGYVDTLSEEALGVLGGIEPDGYPMIQTRSLPERDWTGFNANQNIYIGWAARVKATRNLQEAWAQFKAHPGPGMRPNFRVYSEMFSKFHAVHVEESTALLPGDTPNHFPFPDANLSEFEKARISPPAMRDLYNQMLNEGLRPVGTCLATLVKTAVSMAKAMEYLCDSALYLEAIEILRPPRGKWHPFPTYPPQQLRENLSHIPLPIFSAFIHALCRFQPRLTDEPARAGNRGRIGFLSHAIKLTDLRLPLELASGRRNKAPWHTILRTIAAPRVAIESRGFEDPDANDLIALRLFMHHYKHVEKAMGTDTTLFDALCRVTQKAAAALARRHPGGYQSYWSELSRFRIGAAGGIQDDLRVAHDLMKHSFQTLIRPLDRGGHVLDIPTHIQPINPAHLHLYLRALGYLHDTDEMVSAMRWAIDTWEAEDINLFEDAKDPEHKHHHLMTNAMAFFRAYGDDQAPVEVMRELEARVNQMRDEAHCTWAWPTQDEAQQYREYDERENTQEFWSAVAGEKSVVIEKTIQKTRQLDKKTEETSEMDEVWKAMEQMVVEDKKEKIKDKEATF